MDEQIPKSSRLQWINTTLKFLENDNQLIMEYPEMPVQHMEYLHKLIWQRNNIGLGNNLMYLSLWEATKIFNLKYSFKVFFNTSEDGNTGRLVVEKIPKEYQENDIPANENINNSKQQKKIGTKPSNSHTQSPSKTQKHTPKQDKFFTDCRKIIDSISPAILRKGLQKMLDFLYNKMDGSLIFSELAPIEARFYENFLGIYNRRFEFQGLFSPACNDLLEKMSEFFKEFDKECKLEVYPSKHNMDFTKREVTFMKVPRYTRNISKAKMSPVNTEKANVENSVSVPSALNKVNSCLSNESSKSNVINKKLSATSSIHNLPSMSRAINMLLTSSATKNVSSSLCNDILSAPNNIKTTNNCVKLASNAIDKTISSSSAINKPSTTGNNNVLPLFSVTNDILFKSSAFNKAIPASSAIKNISTVSNATNKSSNMPSGLSAKNSVSSTSSAINNVPSLFSAIRAEDSVSNTRDILQSPSHLSKNHIPPLSSATKTYSASSAGKNIGTALSAKKEVLTSCVMNKSSSPSSDKSASQSVSNIINNKPKSNSSRKEKLMEAMSTPLESEKGLRMMRSMGWEGGALGLRGEGLIEPIIPALHIVPGVGLGHEVPIKTKVKTTKAKTKVDTIDNKSAKINNRLKFLTIILDLLQRDKSIYSASYPIFLAKQEKETFENIINALNMRSNNCLTSVENVSLEKIEKIMTQNIKLSLRLEFSKDMSELTIVKSFDNQVDMRLLKKNKKKKKTVDKTCINDTSASEKFLKDEFALHVCTEILNFIRCEETKLVIAFDAVPMDIYVKFVGMVCECINNKVLIPYTPVNHLAVDILKLSQERCVDLQLHIKKKYFVLYKTCYLITETQNKRINSKHGDNMNPNNANNMLEQKEAAFTNGLDNTIEHSKNKCQGAITPALSSKISADENKPPMGNIDNICKQNDPILNNLNIYHSLNDVQEKITHKNVDNIEFVEMSNEINEITNDMEVIINDDEKDDEPNNQHLRIAKNATLGVLGENKEEINFTQNIYNQIDSLLEKLENYEKTRNTRANSLHRYVDNINNNKIGETICVQNDKENNKQGSGMDEDGIAIGKASSNRINVSKKQDINTNILCEEVDPIIKNLDKYINKTANSKSEVLNINVNDSSKDTDTVSYIFLVDTLHSHVNGDEKSSIYARKDISPVTPALIQDNNLIEDYDKLEKNSHNSNMSKDKEKNELHNLKSIPCNTRNFSGQFNNYKRDNFICTKENRKLRKETKKRAVITIKTDNFKNINESLVEKAIEALTSHSKAMVNIDEIEMHKEIIKTNYYDKSKDNIKVNDHLKAAKSTKLSEIATYTSRKWYKHYENFLKCDEFVEKINPHNSGNEEDLVTHIDENDTLMEREPFNIDLNIYPTELIKENLKCYDKARSTIVNAAKNEPSYSKVIEDISVRLKNLKIEPELSNTLIDNVYMEVQNVFNKALVNTLVLKPEPCHHLINETEAIKVFEKVEEVSIEIGTKGSQNKIELIGSKEIMNEQQEKEPKLEIVEADNKDDEDIKIINKDIAKILNALRNLNTTETIKCHDIIVVESDEYAIEELKNTVQMLIRNNIALKNDVLPLLKYHGVLDDGIVYSCHSKETCLWLKRVLSDFIVKDYRNTIDIHRMKIRVTNFNDNLNLLELLELYYADIKSRYWTIIYKKQINGILIYGVEMNANSFRIVLDNNFILFVGFDVAQFSIGY